MQNNQHRRFNTQVVGKKIHILQGSVVVQLRCGGIFNDHIVANFTQSVLVKEFWKSVNVWQKLEVYSIRYIQSSRLDTVNCT